VKWITNFRLARENQFKNPYRALTSDRALQHLILAPVFPAPERQSQQEGQPPKPQQLDSGASLLGIEPSNERQR